MSAIPSRWLVNEAQCAYSLRFPLVIGANPFHVAQAWCIDTYQHSALIDCEASYGLSFDSIWTSDDMEGRLVLHHGELLDQTSSSLWQPTAEPSSNYEMADATLAKILHDRSRAQEPPARGRMKRPAL
ncbi:unnamed protein product [Cyclocybe aegerita]|uniref:Uncharacterized protein n=1 Tax=Cyclocybe aegerita TaxID=1973307 RepID=A0A8S0VXN6_CYCAE|nr:unnamed protein product [Cyclocybe aegerita]